MDVAISVWLTIFVLKAAGELDKITWKFILLWPGLLLALMLAMYVWVNWRI